MTKRTKKRTKKIVIIVFAVIIGLLVALEIFCVAFKKIKTSAYIEAADNFDNDKYYGYMVEAWDLGYGYPFSTKYELSVTQTRHLDKTSAVANDAVDVLAFYNVFGCKEIWVQIELASGDAMTLYVDEDMNLVDANAEQQEYYEKYYDLIKEDFRVLHEVFGVFNVD